MELYGRNLLKQRIRDLRSLYGFSQEEFSQIYNIPVRTVQNWESMDVTKCPKEYMVDLMEFYYIREGYKKAKQD